MEGVKLAVNGTLMRGFELEKNLLAVDAKFLEETKTGKSYRLWSIRDKNPAMIRVSPEDEKAAQVDVEIWEVPYAGLAKVLEQEPEGLSIGKVVLENGEVVLGVIAEPQLVKGMKEISRYGGWKNYMKDRDNKSR